MSIIDKRIVDMQFNNGEFEKNIATSMKSLEELKNKGLNFDKSTKRLNELQRAGKSFSLEGMAANVQHVADRLSTMGIVGITAIQRITNSAITAGKHLLTSFTIDPVKTGLSEYATQINAIQTILSNTKSKGSTLLDVNEALDELNRYADQTIYNFTEMARNIGTFTAAGVALDQSTAAIKGIANLAAISGSNAQQASVAMYQLSQALSSGTVRLMDWNSVVNAGMGGEVFQNALKETARVHGVAIDAIIKKEGSFRESLQNGWLTSQILTETLQKFTGDLTKEQLVALGYTDAQSEKIIELGKDAKDAATKVRTFTQLIDTLKEALGSGWAQTWENVIGNFEEARDLWSSLSDAIGAVINKSSNQRNELLADWKKKGGRDDLIQGLTEAFEALWGIVLAVGEAMNSIFPPATVDTLLEFSKGVKDLGRNLRLLFYYSTEYTTGFDEVKKLLSGESTDTGTGTLKQGAKGDAVKELQRQLTEAGYVVEQDGIFGKKTKAALATFQKERNLIVDGIFGKESRKNLLEAIGITGKDGFTIEKLANTVTYFGGKLKQLQSIAAGGFAIFDIGIQVFTFLGNVIGLVGDALSPIADMFFTIAAAVGDWFVSVDDGLKKAEPFTSWLETIENLLKPIKAWLTTATAAILKFFGIGSEVDASTGKLQTFADVLATIKEFLFGSEVNTGTTTTAKKGLFQKIGDFLNDIPDWYAKSEMAQAVVSALKGIVNDIKTFLFGSEVNTGTTTSTKPNIIQRIKDFFQDISDWYKESETAQAFVNKLKQIVNDIKVFLFGSEVNTGTTTNSQPNIIQRVKDFFKSISDWYNQSETAQKVVSKLKAIIEDIKAFLFGTEINTGTTTSTTPNIIQRIKTFLEDTYDTFTKNEKVKAIAEAIKTFFEPIIKAIEDFFTNDEGGKKEEDPAKKGEGILGPFIRIWDWLKEKWDGIFAWCERAYNNADSFLKKVGTGGLLGLLIGGLIILDVAGLVGAIKKSALAFSDIVGIIKTKFKNGIKAQPISRSILEIAFAIGLLVAAIYVLGKMDGGELARGAGVLAGIIIVILVLVGLMKKFVTVEQAANLEKVGKSLLSMSLAIGILVAAIYLLSNMDGNQFAKGAALLAVIMIMLSVFIKSMTKFGRINADYKGLIGVAFAIGILALIAWMLGKMDQRELVRGILGLAGIMAVLAIFMIAVNKYGGNSTVQYKGIFPLVLALGLMAGVVWILSKVDWNEGRKGVVALVALMGILAIFMIAVNKWGGSSTVKYGGLIALSIAVAILAGSVMILGGMEPKALLRGSVALVTIMLSFALLSRAASKMNLKSGLSSIVAAIGLAIIMEVFADALNRIKDVNLEKILPFSHALAAIMWSFGSFVKNTGHMPLSGVGTSLLSLLGLVGVISLVVAAFALLTKIPGFQDFMNSGASSIGEIIGSFFNGMFKAMMGLNDIRVSTDAIKNAIACAQMIATFSDKLPKRSLEDRILDWVTGLSDLTLFSGSLKAFGDSFAAFASAMAGITVDEFLELKTAYAVRIATAINTLNAALPPVDSRVALYSWLARANLTNLGLFSISMPTFATSFEKFASGMKAITIDDDLESKTDIVVGIAKTINSLNSELPPVDSRTVLYSWLAQANLTNLGLFQSGMATFGASFARFAEGISGVGSTGELEDKTAIAIKIAERINELNEKLPEVGSETRLWSWLSRSNMTNLSMYSTSVSDFGRAMNSYYYAFQSLTNLKELTVSTAAAVDVAELINTLNKDLPEVGGETRFWSILGRQNMTNLSMYADSVREFGRCFNSFYYSFQSLTNMKELTVSAAAAVDVAELINALNKDLPEVGGNTRFWSLLGGSNMTNLSLYSDSVREFARDFNSYYYAFKSLENLNELTVKSQAAVDIAELLVELNTNLPEVPDLDKFYKWLGAEHITKLSSFSDDMTSFAKGLNAVVGAVVWIETPTGFTDKVDAAVKGAEALKKFLVGLQPVNIGGYRNILDKWIRPDGNNETFFGQMIQFSNSLRTVNTDLTGLAGGAFEANVEAAKRAATSIVGFLAFLSKDVSLQQFDQSNTQITPTFNLVVQEMNSLSQAIVDFDAKTEKVNMERFTSFAWAIGTIGKVLSEISANKDTASFTAFKTSIEALITLFSGNGKDGEKLDSTHFLDGLDSKDITDKLTTFTDTVKGTMDDSSAKILEKTTQFNDAGTSLASALNYGVNAAETDTSGISNMIGALLTAAGDYVGQFYVAGHNLGKGLKNGLADSKTIAVMAAKEVAEAMLRKIEEIFNSHSPSREGIRIGKTLPQGLAIGLTKFGHVATKSAENMGSSVLDTTRDSISGISSLLDSNMESDPVIRPVLDLSNVSAGARSIGGLFSGRQTVAVDSLQSKALASSIRMPGNSATINQNDTSSVANPAAPGGSKFDFTNSQFIFKDKMDFRTFKLELAGLERDDDRAHGSVY